VLIDIPDGGRCYIDATVFYYHLVGTPVLSDDCSDFLKRVELQCVRSRIQMRACYRTLRSGQSVAGLADGSLRFHFFFSLSRRAPSILSCYSSARRAPSS
jgi:predicted nucleic acid-binding protein